MRHTILGCDVDDLTMEETLVEVEGFIRAGQPHQHVVVNVDKIVKANKNSDLMQIINKCDLVNPDGMPVIWASKLLGRKLKERVAGIDLFLNLIARGEKKGWRFYFLGAKDVVLSKVIEKLEKDFPAINIAGFRNGYWQNNEEQEVVNAIKEVKPDILFVAISSPKKENFLGKYVQEMGVPFSMGVGGSFDVVAGVTKRAPLWMQKTGLEWFYRFLQEPTRMFKRYFIDDMYFFFLLGREMLRKVFPFKKE